MQQIQLKVSNVKCGGCVSAIQKGLGEITGVSAVEVDIPSGEVSLQAEPAQLAEIQEKLRTLGYPPIA